LLLNKECAMQKLLFAAVAALCLFFSCQNPVFSPPVIPPPGETTNTGNPPENVSATHGGKRAIALAWDAVPDAVGYKIYRADSPLNPFTPCAETADTRIELAVDAGVTKYYRVSSVYQDNSESGQSGYVMGSSLAQPIISDIVGITESSATVTWYMENVSGETYKNQLLYAVYCFDGPSETAGLRGKIDLEASLIAENKAEFTGLSANTPYWYQVEAYLRDGDPPVSEKSAVTDATTARQFRPDAPLNLRVSKGTSANSLTVSFELPGPVDMPAGEGQFNPHPLYFVISKRLYSGNAGNEYQKVCSYFGTNPDNAAFAINNGGNAATFSPYTSGGTVSWTDPHVTRGMEYEYLVQSYVDNTSSTLTSNSSKSEAMGWAMGVPSLSVGNPVYQLNESGVLYESATLSLHFTFNPKGETYAYTVLETIKPLDDGDSNNPPGTIAREIGPLSLEAVQTYVASMDLTGPSTEFSPGRGLYSYKVRISLGDGTAVDTAAAIGDRQVSEDVLPVEMGGIFVQDGYTDKFVITWDNYPNRKYLLFASDDPEDWSAGPIAVFNDPPADTLEADPASFAYTVGGQEPGVTKYFAMQPVMVTTNGTVEVEKKGQRVYADAASQTMGRPELSPVSGSSYSTITVHFTEVQKADTYRVKYKYTGESAFTTAATVDKPNLSNDGAGHLTYAFNPAGYDDVAKAGKEIQITVDALNEGLREAAGGGEIALSSEEDVRTRLVGPAELAPAASLAASATNITVSWNKISGADGYYVFRRQFNMTNAAEEGAEAVVYYIPDSASPSVTGKLLALVSNQKQDTPVVKASASFASSRYTLTDTYMTDGEYGNAYSSHTDTYRNQQNDMAQGFFYRYFVVPVINRNDSPAPLTSIEFTYAKDMANKNTGITSYTITENGSPVTYSGAAPASLEKSGFVIGFGQNVTATKGTYVNGAGNVNNAIRITWSLPSNLAGVQGFSPRYTLYRKAYGSPSWDTLATQVTDMDFPDNSSDRGKAYEYVVGVTNWNTGASSDPRGFQRFIDRCGTFRDAKNRPNFLGFMQSHVRMSGITRGEDSALNAVLGERVTWQSAGVQSNFSTGYNWGIDGYAVYVMNRNISSGWHLVADNIASVSQINQSIELTPSNTPNVTVTDGIGTITRNVLFVLRDYKHFYKARSYVMDGETKIYGPDPDWIYQYRWGADQVAHIDASNNMENDYVKWGARQIDKTEFIKIASLYAARGQDRVYGTGNWSASTKSGNASGNFAATGSMTIRYNYNLDTSADREFEFSGYKDDLQTRCGDWTTFVTLSGRGWHSNYPIAARPQWYTENGRGWITVTGPWDTPHLYTGKIKFGTGNTKDGTNNLKWSSGFITVIYPENTAESKISFNGSDTALDFTNQSSNGRLNTSYWR
jgi:fibronectin type 3 domain-containing protein